MKQIKTGLKVNGSGFNAHWVHVINQYNFVKNNVVKNIFGSK